MIFLVHQCDVKGCKKNLVVNGNFYNNVQFCMANERDMIPFMGEIRAGCIRMPKLGGRFCVQEHLHNDKELDKVGVK